MRGKVIAIVFVILVMTAPVWAGESTERWPYGPVSAIAQSGPHLVFGRGAVLQVADVSDPRNPRMIGEMALPGVVRGVAVDNGYAYVANGRSGL